MPDTVNPLRIQAPRDASGNLLVSNPPDYATALSTTGDALSDWLTAQRAKSVALGLWDPVTGMPTQAGWQNAAGQYANALLMGTTAPGIRAFHGSPASFERFDPAYIGSGEGAQAYGHGLYFAGNEAVARGYRDTLAGFDWSWPSKKMETLFGQLPQPVQDNLTLNAIPMGRSPSDLRATLASHVDQAQRRLDYIAGGGKPSSASYDPDVDRATIDVGNQMLAMKGFGKGAPAGSMYEVNLGADPEHFLDWDKPLSEQSQHVQDALTKAGFDISYNPRSAAYGRERTGGELIKNNMDQAQVSSDLQAAGIPGIRYLDQGSRQPDVQILSPDQTVHGQWLVKQIPNGQVFYRGPDEAAAREAFANNQTKQTSNYVVFNPDIINIIRKYGIAGLITAGGAVAGTQQPDQQ